MASWNWQNPLGVLPYDQWNWPWKSAPAQAGPPPNINPAYATGQQPDPIADAQMYANAQAATRNAMQGNPAGPYTPPSPSDLTPDAPFDYGGMTSLDQPSPTLGGMPDFSVLPSKAELEAHETPERKAARGARPEGGIPIGGQGQGWVGASPMQQGLFNFGTNFLTSGFQNALPSAVGVLNNAFGQQALMTWLAEQQNKQKNLTYGLGEQETQRTGMTNRSAEQIARIQAETQRQALANSNDIRNRTLDTLSGMFGNQFGGSPMYGGGGGYNPFNVGAPGGAAAGVPGGAPGGAGAGLPYYNWQTQPPTPQQIQQSQVGMSQHNLPGMRGNIAQHQGATYADQFGRGATQTASQLGSQRQAAEVGDILARNQARQRNMQDQWRRNMNQARITQAAIA